MMLFQFKVLTSSILSVHGFMPILTIYCINCCSI